MKQEYQVTILCGANTYKPVSCIIKVEQENETDNLVNNPLKKKEIINRGVNKICGCRRWSALDLKTYGYNKVKVRKYNKLEIEKENKERYERIKEEKYSSGEWTRPKGQS